jgi:hypothetical protein
VQGTIRPNPHLNAEFAARQLKAAFQGMKSDGVTIINILTSHSNHQRQKIKRHYKILYSKVRILAGKTFQNIEVKLHK